METQGRTLTRSERVKQAIKANGPMEIEWDDSRQVVSGWEWVDGSFVKHISVCKAVSVGYIIEETDEYIAIASTHADYEQVMGVVVIPQKSITRRKMLANPLWTEGHRDVKEEQVEEEKYTLRQKAVLKAIGDLMGEGVEEIRIPADVFGVGPITVKKENE